MKKRQSFFVSIIFIFLCLGCTEQYVVVSPILPQRIKKIAVIGFKNTYSPQTDFAEKLTVSVQDRFISDRRVAVVQKQEANALLSGKISRYLLSPIEFNTSKIPTKYVLWVWVDISLYDAVTQKIFWTENRLESKVIYSRENADVFEPTTETEAQDIAINEIASSIVKRTIDGWFAASGVSDRI